MLTADAHAVNYTSIVLTHDAFALHVIRVDSDPCKWMTDLLSIYRCASTVFFCANHRVSGFDLWSGLVCR